MPRLPTDPGPMSPAAVHPRCPVLVGGGQVTDKIARAEQGGTPLQLLEKAAGLALDDTGAGAAVRRGLDGVALVRLTMDTLSAGRERPSQYANFPGALAETLGVRQDAALLLTEGGGNSPQKLVNAVAERIAGGELDCCLVAGVEALDTMLRRRAQGYEPKWEDAEVGAGRAAPQQTGQQRDGCSGRETRHGLNVPVNAYPLFANGLRAHLGQSVEQHRQACGRLFASLNEVAARNPLSWFPARRTAEEIATPGPDNRMVGLPYPKYMNSVIVVNMAAAAVLCSYERACEMGVGRDRMVFLHGCADMNEVWNLSARASYHQAPAIGACARVALGGSGEGGVRAEELTELDIYSCFPSAVQTACREIGLEEPGGEGSEGGGVRPLTLTGGLPYFGGPGNSYSAHAIVEMLHALRGKERGWGLVTANGWYLTKHSMGVYSPSPPAGAWQRPDCTEAQARVDAAAHPVCEDPPPGAAAQVETYTVTHGREGPQLGILLARLDDGRRVVANVDAEDGDTLAAMAGSEFLGQRGGLHAAADGRTLFRPTA